MRYHKKRSRCENVLLVIDDGDMLMLAGGLLAAQRRRVLRAWDAESALWMLQHLRIDRAMIRYGIADLETVRSECDDLGVDVCYMSGFLENGILRLGLPSAKRGTGRRVASAGGK
jgi:hypothetical protein